MTLKKIFFTIFLALIFLANTSYAKTNSKVAVKTPKVKLEKKINSSTSKFLKSELNDKISFKKITIRNKYRTPASAPTAKDYKFSFKYKGESIVLKSKSANFEEAFEKAAKECFHRYRANRHLTEDEGLDIIDVCANPKS